MDAERFAVFLDTMGHQVIQTNSAFWFEATRFAYLSFPFHRPILPTAQELSLLWRASRALVIRYPCPPEVHGYPSYRMICRNKAYDLHDLSPKARNQTRRGLEACVVRQIGFDFLAQQGLDLYVSTLIRQKRKVPAHVSTYWERYCTTAAKVPGFEAWAAFVDNQLAAYSICFVMEDCYNIFIQRSLYEFLRYYPNNAVLYEVTQQALARPGIQEVSFGLESLQQELEGLTHFKLGMGFEKVPVTQRVVFRPLVQPLFIASSSLISRIATKYPDKEFWRKLNGLVRFALASQ